MFSGVLAAGSATSGIILSNGSTNSSGGGARTAAYRASSDGLIYHGDNGVFTSQYRWEQSASTTADFEIRADVTTGSVSGTTGAWLNAGTTRDWSVTDAVISGGVYAAMTLQIRVLATGVVVATSTIELYAERLT